jgi:hypothetical protein
MLQSKEELSAPARELEGEPSTRAQAEALKPLPSGMENLPLLLTSNWVCKLRNCHAGTVRRARKNGLIKATRINARVFLYERDSVLRWLGFLPAETASTPAPPPPKRFPGTGRQIGRSRSKLFGRTAETQTHRKNLTLFNESAEI